MSTNFLTLLEASLSEKAPSGLSDASGRRVKLGDIVKVRSTGKRYTVSTVGSNYAKAQGNGEEIDLTSTFFYVVSENEEIPDDMEFLTEPETCEEEFYTIQNFRSQADIHEALEKSLSEMTRKR